jgi:hypothetical protein
MKNNETAWHIFIIVCCLMLLTIIPLRYTIPVHLQSMDSYHEELTAFSLNVVNNWLTDGIIHDRFLMYPDYNSVEFENNHQRNVYLSYPPGALIPLYVAAKLTGRQELSISAIKHFVQFEYYLSILILGMLFYICLKYIKIKSRLWLLVIPVMFSSLWAFLPFNTYYMNNVYFTDQAVILLSIVFFATEILLYIRTSKKWVVPLQILSSTVLFAGILTDYYFLCIACVAVVFRVINNFQEYPEKSIAFKLLFNTWPLILCSVGASALFILQLLSIPDGLKLLEVTCFIRTGSGAEHGGIKLLAQHHFRVGFSFLFLPVLLFVTLFCLIFPLIRKHFSREQQMIIHGLSMITLSSVLHTLILREHSIVHEFSMLKYNLVFVFIIFAFICWLLMKEQGTAAKRTKKIFSIIVHATLGLVFLFIVGLQGYNHYFYNLRANAVDHSLAYFIRANTNYYDVVYSPDYEIYWNPPQNLAISRKRVYRIAHPANIPLRQLPDHAIINLLISRDSLQNHHWRVLHTQKIPAKESDNFYLFKFSRESFQKLFYPGS